MWFNGFDYGEERGVVGVLEFGVVSGVGDLGGCEGVFVGF